MGKVKIAGIGLAVLAVLAAGSFVAFAGGNTAQPVSSRQADDEGEQNLTLAQVPAAVAATIRAHVAEAKINEIQLDDENGVKVYSIEVKEGSGAQDFLVAPDGRYLGLDTEDQNGEEDASEAEEPSLTMAQVPAAVAATIKAQAGSATIGKIEQDDENGVQQYSFECTANGATKEGKVATDGRFIGWEANDDAAEANEAEEHDAREADEPSLTLAQVPAAVAATIRAQAAGAAIKEIELDDENGVKSYSVEVVAGNSTRDFKVALDGRFLGNEQDEQDGENGRN